MLEVEAEAGRVINAAPDRVFAALTVGGAVAAWLPPRGFVARVDRFEPHAGGTILATLSASNEAETAWLHRIEGSFVEVEPYIRVVQRFAHPLSSPADRGWTTMSWLLRPALDGTDVRLLSADPPPGLAAADHEAGLREALGRIAALVEMPLFR